MGLTLHMSHGADISATRVFMVRSTYIIVYMIADGVSIIGGVKRDFLGVLGGKVESAAESFFLFGTTLPFFWVTRSSPLKAPHWYNVTSSQRL